MQPLSHSLSDSKRILLGTAPVGFALQARGIRHVGEQHRVYHEATWDAILVADGRLDPAARRQDASSLPPLRAGGALHLVELERSYLEPNGSFSRVQSARHTAGLAIGPGWHREFPNQQPQHPQARACGVCGTVTELSQAQGPCSSYGASNWATAIEPSRSAR